MTREALHAARLVALFLATAVAVSFLLVLLASVDHGAGFAAVTKGTALATVASFGAHGSVSLGPATLAATGTPMLASLVAFLVTWRAARNSSVPLTWIAAVAVLDGFAVFGLGRWGSGWHGASISAAVGGLVAFVCVVAACALARAGQRWPQVQRPVDLVVGAVVAVVVLGILAELVAGLSYSGGGGSGSPGADIALALAYAPNAGLAALGLGLGGRYLVTSNVTAYEGWSIIAAKVIGDGPVAAFGTPHGEGDWARALHLPGLVSVVVLAPLTVLAVAWSARFLRDRAELVIWALGLTVALVGLSLASDMSAAVNYSGFVMSGELTPNPWSRIAGLSAVPLGLAVFVLTRSTVEPRLDLVDRARQGGRKVS